MTIRTAIMKAKTQILLGAATDIGREGLRSILRESAPDWQIQAVPDYTSLKDALVEAVPDAVLIAHDEDDFDDNILAQLPGIYQQLRFILIAPLTAQTLLQKLMRQSVHGLLTPECSRRELVQATEAVLQGDKFYCHSVVERMIAGTEAPEEANTDEALSLREQEVLIALAQGRSNAEVADQLSLSLHTVRTHRRNLMRKIGARSITEVVRYAYNLGWLE